MSTLVAMQVFSFPIENISFSTERWSRGTNQKKPKKFWCLLLKAVGNKELGYRKNGDKEERLVVVGTPQELNDWEIENHLFLSLLVEVGVGKVTACKLL